MLRLLAKHKHAPSKAELPTLPDLSSANMLTVDIGRRTGWCECQAGQYVSSGVHELYAEGKKHRPWSDGERFLAFSRFLDSRQACQVVAFEQVHSGTHSSSRQTALYSGFRAILMAWAAQRSTQVIPIPVGTIKKCLSGKGNASKAEMIAATRDLGLPVFDDNEADAIGIAVSLFMLPSLISKQSTADQLPVDSRKRPVYRKPRSKAQESGGVGRGGNRVPRKAA